MQSVVRKTLCYGDVEKVEGVRGLRYIPSKCRWGYPIDGFRVVG